ncbi:MAG: DUF3304 domain-containing protein, partial [Synechococcaceae bacterium WB9_2_112]|nr:DUF3304 domain-containing protein [Synechococcaceae bacterium WB9_2_112]
MNRIEAHNSAVSGQRAQNNHPRGGGCSRVCCLELSNRWKTHQQTLKIEVKKFYLASSYFLRGLPPKYRRRCSVSQPSSRWI